LSDGKADQRAMLAESERAAAFTDQKTPPNNFQNDSLRVT
jgi:hypothetical protein